MEDDVPLDKEDCLVVLDEDGQEAGVDRQTQEGTDRVKHPGLTGSQRQRKILTFNAETEIYIIYIIL